jgi:malonyl-CoA/methylmalonyl-CoA synthetase
MGVPTMYSYMLAHQQNVMDPTAAAAAAAAAAGLRLTVCGSSAAPPALMAAWRQLSGHMLLERYGMTETGMLLSNPYKVSLCVVVFVYV